MPNAKVNSVFVTATLPTPLPEGLEDFDKSKFFTEIVDMCKTISPPLRWALVYENGQSGDHLHLHYAAEWSVDRSIYTEVFRRNIKKLYTTNNLPIVRNRTVVVKAASDFYKLVGGYFEKEGVVDSYGLDEALLAKGRLEYVKQQAATKRRAKDMSARDKFIEHIIAYMRDTHQEYPSTHKELEEMINSYMHDVWAKGKGPAIPLTSQTMINQTLWCLAIKCGVSPHNTMEMWKNYFR